MVDEAEVLMKLAAPQIRYDRHAEAQLARIVDSKSRTAGGDPVKTQATRVRESMVVLTTVLIVLTSIIPHVEPQTASAKIPPPLEPQSLVETAESCLSQCAAQRRAATDSYTQVVAGDPRYRPA